MNKSLYKIAVAGAGIAGLAAATQLARAGHDVTVYDQLPKPAPVGSGLIVQPVGQTVLEQIGLLAAVSKRAAPLRRLYAVNMEGRTVLNVRYGALGEGVHGLGTHRAALFDCLHQAFCESGAAFETGRRVRDVDSGADGALHLICDKGERAGGFDLVIDAMGLKSPFVKRDNAYLNFGALWANITAPDDPLFPGDALTQRYSKADRSSGVMPIGEGQSAFFWTLRQSSYEEWRERGIDAWKEDVARLWPEVIPHLSAITDPDQLIFARYAHHSWHTPVEGRLVHIGDAWHAASPQLGQGANLALMDAAALADAVAKAPNLDKALARFLKQRSSHIRLYQMISWAFTPIYQSDSKILPWLRDLLAGPVSDLPFVQRRLAAMVAGRLGAGAAGV